MLIKKLLLAFIIAMITSHGFAQQNGAQYRDWTIECIKLNEQTQSCGLSNTVRQKANNQFVAKVTLTQQLINNRNILVMTIIVPHNVYLPSGVAVKVATNNQQDNQQEPQYKINYFTCTQASCEAQGFVDGELKQKMKKGTNMIMGYVDAISTQTITFPISLLGITAGLDALGVQ